MVSKIKTFSFSGIEAIPVDVEVKITSGNPTFTIVGLPDKAVGESKERVRAAISSSGLEWPFQKIIVNLAPADVQKEGSHFDLAIALGIIVEIGALKQNLIDNFFIMGELSLDGSINSVNGIISAAISANERKYGIICPKDNGKEAVWAGDLEVIAPNNLNNLLNHFLGENKIQRPQIQKQFQEIKYPDLSDVKGQQNAKRALEISASGGHNMLMIGPPGAGKSMLSSRLPSILPPLELMEILEVNMIASLSGKINDGKLITSRPYREVHHSCSMPAMVGGGSKARPGEVSLSHNGVMFLDELGEFPRQVLESLRQPLENGKITIARANCHISYPADFQLISSMNPCKCGFLGDPKRECRRAPHCGEEYKSRISGPFLDRIDIIIHVNQVDIFANKNQESESSQDISDRVIRVREIQRERYSLDNDMQKNKKINSHMNNKAIEKYCGLDDNCEKILKVFVEKSQSSMRGINRILKVSRTIADMDGSKNIQQHHLLEAISYRSFVK